MPRTGNRRAELQAAQSERGLIVEALRGHGVQVPYEMYLLEYNQVHNRVSRKSEQWDSENIVTKFATDALVELGVLQDDSFKHLPRRPEVFEPVIDLEAECESVRIVIKLVSFKESAKPIGVF